MFQWDSTYSVGDEKMDKQHKQLFGLISALQKYNNEVNKNYLKKVLNTLVDYMSNHFAEEEQLMMRIKFPHLASHRKEHQKFIVQIRDFELAFKRGDQDLSNQMLEFLKVWLAQHILVFDKEYEKCITTEVVPVRENKGS